MRQRTAKLASNSARQPSAGHQLAPQQIQQTQQPMYARGKPDYSQGIQQVSWQQPVATQGYQQPPQTPSRQYQQKGQFSSNPHVEQVDGAPHVIHHGKIQMKDAITLITLRLAKLEEMTSTPIFHSVMNGTIGGGDIDGDNVSAELIESINERLNGLESNVGLLFERTEDLHLQLEEMKTNIQTIVDGTSIDHTDLIIQPSQLNDDNVDIFQNGLIQHPITSTTLTTNITENADENEDDEEEDQ